MAERLDKTGLSYLWGKIVAKINAKKTNQVEPLSENLDTGAISRLSSGNINTTNDTMGVLQTFQATATMKKTADGSYPEWDANVLMMNWDTTQGYSTQLAQRNLTGEIKVRGQEKKTWGAWRTVLDSANKDTLLLNFIQNKGNFTGDIDATDIAVGLYALDNFSLTTPSGTKAVFGSFIQFGGLYKTQLVACGITGKSGLLYIRRYMTATQTWSDWYEYQEEIEAAKTSLDGKVSKSGDTMTNDLTVSKASGDTYFRTIRTDKSLQLGFGIGSGGVNRGIYDYGMKKWIFHSNGTTVFANNNINIGQVLEYGNASFTYSDGFAAYNTTANNTQEPRASKWGRVVNLTGAFKTTVARESTASVVIGKVPSGCEPLHDVRVRQQGTGQNSYLLTISTSGNLIAERYGVATNTAIPNGVWLNINATYISKA